MEDMESRSLRQPSSASWTWGVSGGSRGLSRGRCGRRGRRGRRRREGCRSRLHGGCLTEGARAGESLASEPAQARAAWPAGAAGLPRTHARTCIDMYRHVQTCTDASGATAGALKATSAAPWLHTPQGRPELDTAPNAPRLAVAGHAPALYTTSKPWPAPVSAQAAQAAEAEP